MSAGNLLTLGKMLILRRNDVGDDLGAMREIVDAWRRGRLQLTAEHHVMGPAIEPTRKVLKPDAAFSERWDWVSSRALGKIGDVWIDFRQIATTRAEFETLWPPRDKGGAKSYEIELIAEARLLIANGFSGKKESLAKDVLAALREKGTLEARGITKASWKTIMRYIRSVRIPS